MNQFNPGDHIYKMKNGIPDTSSIYTILDIREEKGGNWHDGYTISYVAKIQKSDFIEEYTLHFVNYMCQIDLYFVCKVNN
jgi:hypothetical protein